MKRILSFAILTGFATVAVHSPLSAKFTTTTRKLEAPETVLAPNVGKKSEKVKMEKKPAKLHLRKEARIRGTSYSYSNSGLYINDGEINVFESIKLACGTFLGKGELRAPEISIEADKFEFKGTIDCSGKCTITTKESVDESLFKRKGTGQFIINGKEVAVTAGKAKDKDNSKKDRKDKGVEKAVFPPLQNKEVIKSEKKAKDLIKREKKANEKQERKEKKAKPQATVQG